VIRVQGAVQDISTQKQAQEEPWLAMRLDHHRWPASPRPVTPTAAYHPTVVASVTQPTVTTEAAGENVDQPRCATFSFRPQQQTSEFGHFHTLRMEVISARLSGLAGISAMSPIGEDALKSSLMLLSCCGFSSTTSSIVENRRHRPG
jgi:hypothetical protein